MTLKRKLTDLLEIKSEDPGIFSFSKGQFTLRREYYWRPKKTPEESFAKTLEKLQQSFDVTDVEYGDEFKSFKGGEGVRKNSHYWMRFKAAEKLRVTGVERIGGMLIVDVE